VRTPTGRQAGRASWPWRRWGALWLAGWAGWLDAAPAPRTVVSIEGEHFRLNGRPTYEGRTWRSHRLEGLLLNSRMVQGIFDERNPATVSRWAYPDPGRWDAERNTREFLEAMPQWRRHGLMAFTLNLQGGSPQGYSSAQPMNNFVAALSERASWGFFDFRMKGEGYDEGYQSVPVNWGISSARKRGFFGLLAEMTGAKP
jgi:hypothetical protein